MVHNSIAVEPRTKGARVDHVMVSNFVTAIQAQRKWYTNVLSKVSAGNYKIGAVRDLLGMSCPSPPAKSWFRGCGTRIRRILSCKIG